MQAPTFEKDGYKLNSSDPLVEGASSLENGCQARLNFVVDIGGGVGEEEPMYVRVKGKNSDGSYVGTLCGISMNSDRLQPDQEIFFLPQHVSLIKTKEMIEKEKAAFGIFARKQEVVASEREEYYKKLDKEKEEEERRQKEEAAKFMSEGGFFFGGDMGGDSEPVQQEEDPSLTGEKKKREGECECDCDEESPSKKRRLD